MRSQSPYPPCQPRHSLASMPYTGLPRLRVVVNAHECMPQRVIDVWVGRLACAAAMCVGERSGDGGDDVSSYPRYCSLRRGWKGHGGHRLR
jgi:hypothetical protein